MCFSRRFPRVACSGKLDLLLTVSRLHAEFFKALVKLCVLLEAFLSKLGCTRPAHLIAYGPGSMLTICSMNVGFSQAAIPDALNSKLFQSS